VEVYDWRTNTSDRSTAGGVGPAYEAATQPVSGGSTTAGLQSQSVSAASFNSVDSQQPLTTHYQQPPSLAQFDMVPAKSAPPLGLDGCCPVQLMKVRNFARNDPRFKYTKGDPRYGVVHRGRTYLFCGPAEQQEFLKDPDRYSPVMAGNDPVLLLEEGRQVPGTRELGFYFGDRIYLFATSESQAKFNANRHKYAELIQQAQHLGRGTMR
jgi:protein disulfide-isomerase